MDDSGLPRPRWRAAMAAALGLAAVGALGTVAFATRDHGPDDVVQARDGAPGATARPAPGCVVAETAEQDLWVDAEDWAAVMDRVETALARKFGRVSKTDQRTPLVKGLVGRALDHGSKEFVVVADPAKVDLAALEADLDAVAAGVTAVRVQAGCHSTDELLGAERVLHARNWHPDVRKISYGSHLDAGTSTYYVVMPAGPVADALKARLGDLVTLEEGVARRG